MISFLLENACGLCVPLERQVVGWCKAYFFFFFFQKQKFSDVPTLELEVKIVLRITSSGESIDTPILKVRAACEGANYSV